MKIGKTMGYLVAIVAISGLFATVTGCGTRAVTGSGNLETWEMDYSDFTRVEVDSAFEVEISQADSYRVSITTDDNLYRYLDVSRRGNTLRIGLKLIRMYFNTTRKAIVTMPDLQRLSLSDASECQVSGFESGNPVDFDLSGASDLYVDNLKAGDTKFGLSGASRASGIMQMADGKFDLSGASRLELEGSANDISIGASGASTLGLGDFPVSDVDIHLSGASVATINASGRLDAHLSGASKLDYTGDPTPGGIDISGGSSINKK